MSQLKEQIQQLYINAIYNDEAPSSFASKMLELIGADEERQTRSARQSRSRWKYLTMVASVLNDRGDNFTPYLFMQKLSEIQLPMKFNKDLLYLSAWESTRHVLYPEKKRQLNTKEFANLSEHVVDLFDMYFDVHIPFPNIQDLLNKKDAEEGRY